VGANAVAISVCDAATNPRCTTQTFTVTVAIDQAPVITSVPGTTAIAGRPYRYQVVATDADSTITTYALVTPSPAPGNLAIDATGLLTWTPTAADVGTVSIQLKVTDALMLSAVQSFALTVLPSGQPYFTSIPSTTAVEGVAYAYQAVAVDPGNPTATFTYSLTSPPSGDLQVSPTGALTWTPSAKEHGSVTVTIQAQTTAGTATQSFTVTVLSKNVEAANSSSGCGCVVGERGGSERASTAALVLIAFAVLVVARSRRRRSG
jgi:MYXO-CTERM domain-containing protein